MPESQKRAPSESELVAWALFQALEDRSFDTAEELHDEMQRLSAIPNWRLHAELYIDSEDFREEFQSPPSELLRRAAAKGDR